MHVVFFCKPMKVGREKNMPFTLFMDGNKKPRVKTRGFNQNQLLRKKIIVY